MTIYSIEAKYKIDFEPNLWKKNLRNAKNG